jgi:hypothetical protein
MTPPAPTVIHDAVVEILKDVSRRPIEPTFEHDLVADLGFDSLQVLETIAALEDRFDISAGRGGAEHTPWTAGSRASAWLLRGSAIRVIEREVVGQSRRSRWGAGERLRTFGSGPVISVFSLRRFFANELRTAAGTCGGRRAAPGRLRGRSQSNARRLSAEIHDASLARAGDLRALASSAATLSP